MDKTEIRKQLQEWWNDDLICAGKSTCCIDECDLCFNCFDKLCKRLGCKLEGLNVKSIEVGKLKR